jgi:thiol-disulfide isomerase/thioredoxin
MQKNMNKRLKNRISCFVNTVLLCFVMVAGMKGNALAAPAAAVTSPAPAFSGVGLDGKAFASEKLAGKVYIINFFASWCPPCRSEIPDMVSLQNQYSRNGFTFVGVAVNETVPAIKSFMAKNRIAYPVLMANDQLMNSYGKFIDGGIQGIPTSFVVSSSGKVIQIITGAKSRADFEQIILSALRQSGKIK